MRWSAAIPLAAVFAFAAAPAHAGMSLGANLGLAFFHPDAGDDVTIFSLPNQGTTPGVRMGWAPRQEATQIYLDLGFASASVAGASSSVLVATGNLQYDLRAAQPLSLFVTAGGGVLRESAKSGDDAPSPFDLSATSVLFGGGVGLRRRIAGGHGTLRTELRYDQRTEGKDGDARVITQGGVVQLKLGFDVWN